MAKNTITRAAPSRRTLNAHHEAAHAVAALAVGWHPPAFVELDPEDLPDCGGRCRHEIYSRDKSDEDPWRELETNAGGYITLAAGWLAECELRRRTGGGSEPEDDPSFTLGCYEDFDGVPDWSAFYVSASPLLDPVGRGDGAGALDHLDRAAEYLCLPEPTEAMHKALRQASERVVRRCWPAIRALARALDERGWVGQLRDYWPGEPLPTVARLCASWCRRSTFPEVREMCEYWPRAAQAGRRSADPSVDVPLQRHGRYGARRTHQENAMPSRTPPAALDAGPRAHSARLSSALRDKAGILRLMEKYNKAQKAIQDAGVSAVSHGMWPSTLRPPLRGKWKADDFARGAAELERMADVVLGNVVSNHAEHAVVHFADRPEPGIIKHGDRGWTKHLAMGKVVAATRGEAGVTP